MAQKKKKGGKGGKSKKKAPPHRQHQHKRQPPRTVSKNTKGGAADQASAQQRVAIPPAALQYLKQDDNHKPATWSKEQIERFLVSGQFDDSSSGEDASVEQHSEASTTDPQEIGNGIQHSPIAANAGDNDSLDLTDVDLRYALQPMPEPGDVNAIYQTKSNGDGAGLGDMTCMLSTLLDPDAGGRGRNATGIEGMIAASRASQGRERPVDPRERLRLRMRMMRKMRGAEGSMPAMTDNRGRKMRGAVAIDATEMAAAGLRMPRNAQLQKPSTKKRRNLIEEMRARLEQRKALSASADPAPQLTE